MAVAAQSFNWVLGRLDAVLHTLLPDSQLHSLRKSISTCELLGELAGGQGDGIAYDFEIGDSFRFWALVVHVILFLLLYPEWLRRELRHCSLYCAVAEDPRSCFIAPHHQASKLENEAQLSPHGSMTHLLVNFLHIRDLLLVRPLQLRDHLLQIDATPQAHRGHHRQAGLLVPGSSIPPLDVAVLGHFPPSPPAGGARQGAHRRALPKLGRVPPVPVRPMLRRHGVHQHPASGGSLPQQWGPQLIP
mmetsp:Transcript_27264/g.65692  ORF Transcript_27264/g.65692 Transcript_27264/m.65692 type:complete len:246 (+) Transcript_27264:477-1214(+)